MKKETDEGFFQPEKSAVKMPKDSDYDGEEETQIRFMRKKPISFVAPAEARTVRNADAKRGKDGVNVATSMSDLPEWQDLYKQGDSGKRKYAQTVIERIRVNEKDKKGSDDEDLGQDMSRRMARMKLLAGNDFSCKVEIMPIDNQKDHYYIMT